MASDSDLMEALTTLDGPVEPTTEEREQIWEALTAPSRVAPPASSSGLGRGLRIMAAVAASVVLLGLGATWLRGGPNPNLAETPTPGSVDGEGYLALPESHEAARILASGARDTETFSKEARDGESSFVCASGAMSQLCLLYDTGLLAVVPLDVRPGFRGQLSGAGLDEELSVPLDRGPLAVPAPGGRIAMTVVDRWGDWQADMEGRLEPEIREPVSLTQLSESHLLVRLIAETGNSSENLAGAGPTGTMHMCHQGTGFEVCAVWADGITAVVALSGGDGLTATLRGDGIRGEVTVPLEESMAFPSGAWGEVRLTVERDGENLGSVLRR